VSGELFLLFKFLFDFSHLLAHTVVWAHRETLSYELDTENEEQSSGSKVCEAFREECGDGMAHYSRENCHDDQGGEGSREDEKSRVSHSHECRNEERLVSNFGKDDHGESEYEGMERLYDAGVDTIVEC
jgi:hypothetical protein